MDTSKALLVLWVLAVGWCCDFPADWHGKWFHSDLGEVSISRNNITKKGVCLEQDKDHYLLENRESEFRCYTCLWLESKHHNVLQYRESHCVGLDTMHRICEQIHLETVLQILIREPSEPAPCPFEGAFHFSYNNNSGGFCRNPSSYTKPCANRADYHFHFKHCSDAAYTHHKEIDMQCLGNWQDGDDNYMLAQLSDLHGRQRGYRCLMYNKQGTLMHMAISADASCRGLLNPRSGSLVLELTEDVFGWPSPACTFPAWMTKSSWRDLSGRRVYKPGEQGNIISLLYRRHQDDKQEVHQAFRCVRPLPVNSSQEHFTFVSFSTHKCVSRYQCMQFIRRKDNVVEVHAGRYLEYGTDPCWQKDLEDASKHLLIPLSSQEKPCPIPGRYHIHTGSAICDGYFRSGCNGTDVIDIVSTCSSKPGVQLQCLKAWREKKVRYLVAKAVNDPEGTANCFSFQKSGSSLRFSIDDQCNMGTPNILRDSMTYVINSSRLECDYRKEMKDVSAENQSRPKNGQQNDEPALGGPYTHVGESKQTRDERKADKPSAASSRHALCDHRFVLVSVLLTVSQYVIPQSRR